MCMKVVAKVTASDIKLGKQGEGDSCAIARTLKREGFKFVQVEPDTITATKFGVEWEYDGTVHNKFIGDFDENKRDVKPREFKFTFEPSEVVEKPEDKNNE